MGKKTGLAGARSPDPGIGFLLKTYTPEVKTTNKTVFFFAELGFLVPWLGRSTTVPDYAQLVNAMVGERISTATGASRSGPRFVPRFLALLAGYENPSPS
jgi:hypothetical protein